MLILTLLAAYGWVATPSIAAEAASPPVVLTGPVDNEAMKGHIDFFIDPDWRYSAEDMAGRMADQFQAVDRNNPDFGYTQSKIWLRTSLVNATDDNSEWRVFFAENFKQAFDVWAVREDGGIESLLSLGPDSGFDARTVPYPELTAPLNLAPGEKATILVSLWSEGSSYVEFSVETLDSFSAMAARDTAKNFVFYGMTLVLIVFAIAALAVFRHVIFLAYVGYATSALIYVMHADGVTFQYLWPQLPALNSMASVYAGSGLIVFGAIYSTLFLQTRNRHPLLHKALLAVIGVTLALDVSLIATAPQLLKKSLVMMSLAAIFTFTLSAIVAATKRFREVRFYLLAWVGALMSATLLNLSHIFGFDIGQELLYDSMRGVMVFDAAMMGLAIADKYNQLRQSRQAALSDSLSKANRNIELTRRLRELEEQYDVAKEMSKSRGELIQDTVHDLRQPIHALRLSVNNLLRGRVATEEEAQNLESTFAYLESLVADHLAAPFEAGFAPHSGEQNRETQGLGVPEILAGVHEMFASDAAEKGLDFVFEPGSADAPVEPLVLMRIVSNLVSNAIKYTDEGRVSLSSQFLDDVLLIRIGDTGPGLSQSDFDAACGRNVRLGGDQNGIVKGDGLGLAITENLARRHGIVLRAHPAADRGTIVELVVPTRGKSRELQAMLKPAHDQA